MTKADMPQASDFKPEVLKLFDKYVHGLIDRRTFLNRSARYTAGAAGAAATLAALAPDFARAQQVKPDDARIRTDWVEIASPKGYGTIKAYVTRPADAAKPLPVVLVAHENRGLNPHIEDIARRLALENFIAVAPDALTPLGGYPGDEDKAREAFAKLDQAKTREDFVAAAGYALKVEGGNGSLGTVGFCYGGGIANLLATCIPELKAAVPFYGAPPPLEAVPDIKAELLLNFAGNDDRVNAQWPAYEAALKAAAIRYHAFVYPGVEHGFNNDTTPRFNAEAAKLAWMRTLELFNRTLRA
ncbi:dienelactone hydrolase family protein [Asticcacaulis taihuensis]|uniref:Carboxymethylenebutenolidase n=1 Tax=Asticcacaulis taihuensis TaxID=260084 RepID=A0A1G4T9A9_9CAUL|nr:dienelactone hydrolase family protein [Asticcacaulis taihuensis]SCW78023.1 carboxymethylenebutenolidase [Asticcacaulis taihuensis]